MARTPKQPQAGRGRAVSKRKTVRQRAGEEAARNDRSGGGADDIDHKDAGDAHPDNATGDANYAAGRRAKAATQKPGQRRGAPSASAKPVLSEGGSGDNSGQGADEPAKPISVAGKRTDAVSGEGTKRANDSPDAPAASSAERRSSTSQSSYDEADRIRRDDKPQQASSDNRQQNVFAGEPADMFGRMFSQMFSGQAQAAQRMMAAFLPQTASNRPDDKEADGKGGPSDNPVRAMQQAMETFWQGWPGMAGWSAAAGTAGNAWTPTPLPTPLPMPLLADPQQWMRVMQGWFGSLAAFDTRSQAALWDENFRLWQDILLQYGIGPQGDAALKLEPDLPRTDRRFADPAWRDQPVFALIHQTYLLFADRIAEAVDRIEAITERERDHLRFATRSVLDAMSPANFPLMNPQVLERTIKTGGQNLVTGMARLTVDLERGQLTHTDASKFRLGENVACTPGKVVHETPLFQLIQYAPVGEDVLAVPLVIFPPWINRFYILDLNPKKSFVRWAVEQGVTVFMVSWRSADESLAHIEWDDYVRAPDRGGGLHPRAAARARGSCDRLLCRRDHAGGNAGGADAAG